MILHGLLKRYNNEASNDKLLVILTTSTLTYVSFALVKTRLEMSWNYLNNIEPTVLSNSLCSFCIDVDALQHSSHSQTKVHFND